MTKAITTEQLTIVAANEASWDDLAAIFGTAGYAARCRYLRFKSSAGSGARLDVRGTDRDAAGAEA